MSAIIVMTPPELEALVQNAVLKAIQAIPAPQKAGAGKYITKAEAADLCRCSVKTIETRLKEGVWRHRKDGTAKASRVLILAEDVHKYITQGITDNRFKR